MGLTVDDQHPRKLPKPRRPKRQQRPLPERRLAQDVPPTTIQRAIDINLLLDLIQLRASKPIMRIRRMRMQAKQNRLGLVRSIIENEPSRYIIPRTISKDLPSLRSMTQNEKKRLTTLRHPPQPRTQNQWPQTLQRKRHPPRIADPTIFPKVAPKPDPALNRVARDERDAMHIDQCTS